MIFVDTHTHLFLEQFSSDRDKIVKQSIDAGVKYMLLPNVDSSTSKALLDLSEQYPGNCIPMTGLHPTSVKSDFWHELEQVETLLTERDFCAIGEIGIDLYWDKTFRKEQEEAFRYQIDLAKQYNKPIVIHARESFDEIFKVMHDVMDDDLTGVFHSFTGDENHAKQIEEWGFKIGIGGIVTFKNSGLDRVVEKININNIVLETDSPYLAPVPKRGKRNESSYLTYIAEKIAEIKNISLNDVAAITTRNASDLFKIEFN